MTVNAPISADEGRRRIEAGARVVDVRSEAGRQAAGSLLGAEPVAKDAVDGFATTTDKDEELVVFCGTTAGSGPVVDYLTEQGFTNVVHVDGGFQALADAGVPVERVSPDDSTT